MSGTEQNYKEEELNYLTISEVHLAHSKISNYNILESSVRKAPSRKLKGLWEERKGELLFSEVILGE